MPVALAKDLFWGHIIKRPHQGGREKVPVLLIEPGMPKVHDFDSQSCMLWLYLVVKWAETGLALGFWNMKFMSKIPENYITKMTWSRNDETHSTVLPAKCFPGVNLDGKSPGL